MKKIGFSIEKEENKNTQLAPAPQAVEEPVRSVVTVRFPGGREYPYYNDMFRLNVGDVVYVDGKLAGKAGVVTEVTTRFKVSLDFYKRVLAKLNIDISGKFGSVKGFMVSANPNTVTADQATSWFIPPREEEEEFFVGDGYTVDLDEFPDYDGFDPQTLYSASKIIERGALRFINVTNGNGVAFVEGSRFHRVDFTVTRNGMITDLLCDCIEPSLCPHCFSACIAINDIIKNDSFDITNFTAIERDTFFKIIDFKDKEITAKI